MGCSGEIRNLDGFLYLDLQSNPARAFRNFEVQLAEGDNLLFDDGSIELKIPE